MPTSYRYDGVDEDGQHWRAMMKLHDERHVNFAEYRSIPDDEVGLTPFQILERRASTRRVTALRYDAEMNREKAEAVMALPVADLMARLEIDEEQAGDLRELACRYLERIEMAGAR